MRGDEPYLKGEIQGTDKVFPTCVGMNRDTRFPRIPTMCVPHVRGDEPRMAGMAATEMMCSPRAWG